MPRTHVRFCELAGGVGGTQFAASNRMSNLTDPTELAKRAAIAMFRTDNALAAAIVYGEAAKLAPDDPEILCGFGAGVGNSAGQLVVAPFVQWSTRILERCVGCGDSPYANVARERLAELRS